jgi:hypothetical protein
MKLRGDKNKLANIKNIIINEINNPELAVSKVPWWFWLIIGISLVCIIVGIAAFSLSPYNYIVLVLGIIGFLGVGILFCKRFGQKRSFAEDGMRILDAKYGKYFEILKVYENKDETGDKKALRSLIFISKEKKSKKKKKSMKESGVYLGNDKTKNQEDTFIDTKPVSFHEDDIYKKKKKVKKTNKKSKVKKNDEETTPLQKNQTDSAKKKSHYYSDSFEKNDFEAYPEEIPENNLRLQESNFSNVAAPEDPYELRTSIDFHNENQPQNFYNPASMGDQQIESYDNYKRQTAGSLSSNPYNANPVMDEKKEKPNLPEPEDDVGLNTIEIDLQNFGKDKDKRRRSNRRRG